MVVAESRTDLVRPYVCPFIQGDRCADTVKLRTSLDTGSVDEDRAEQHYELCTTAGHTGCSIYSKLDGSR